MNATQPQWAINPLLKPKETASFFGVCNRTLDRWNVDGTIPAEAKVIIGGSVRYRTDVLLQHIEALASANGADRPAATSDEFKRWLVETGRCCDRDEADDLCINGSRLQQYQAEFRAAQGSANDADRA